MRFAEILNENTELNALMSKHGWPSALQKEMYDEWVGRDADEDSFKFVKSLKLQSAQPVTVSTKELLSKQENMDNVSRAPQEVIDAINKKWGTNISIGPQYDPTPERYFKYAKMPAATAKPSIMVDGEIIMGVGRFVAALLRGDKQIKVWNLRSATNEAKLSKDEFKQRLVDPQRANVEKKLKEFDDILRNKLKWRLDWEIPTHDNNVYVVTAYRARTLPVSTASVEDVRQILWSFLIQSNWEEQNDVTITFEDEDKDSVVWEFELLDE